MAKNKGIIKWFNNEIGCGFIETKDGKNIFINDLSVEKDSIYRLHEGAQVKFDVIGGSIGLVAVNVHRI